MFDSLVWPHMATGAMVGGAAPGLININHVMYIGSCGSRETVITVTSCTQQVGISVADKPNGCPGVRLEVLT
jgi:hypothetical protein